jgi:hypothetical protein
MEGARHGSAPQPAIIAGSAESMKNQDFSGFLKNMG